MRTSYPLHLFMSCSIIDCDKSDYQETCNASAAPLIAMDAQYLSALASINIQSVYKYEPCDFIYSNTRSGASATRAPLAFSLTLIKAIPPTDIYDYARTYLIITLVREHRIAICKQAQIYPANSCQPNPSQDKTSPWQYSPGPPNTPQAPPSSS
jgi:hypothetical protein